MRLEHEEVGRGHMERLERNIERLERNIERLLELPQIAARRR